MRIIIREARRSSDNGWLNYDRIFRQNAAANPLLSWANLDPSLHASFCAKSSTSICTLCNEPDHMAQECATRPQHSGLSAQSTSLRPERQRICLSWNAGQCMLPGSCSFLHVCATCKDHHRARDCPQTPLDSLPKKKFKSAD